MRSTRLDYGCWYPPVCVGEVGEEPSSGGTPPAWCFAVEATVDEEADPPPADKRIREGVRGVVGLHGEEDLLDDLVQ